MKPYAIGTIIVGFAEPASFAGLWYIDGTAVSSKSTRRVAFLVLGHVDLGMYRTDKGIVIIKTPYIKEVFE